MLSLHNLSNMQNTQVFRSYWVIKVSLRRSWRRGWGWGWGWECLSAEVIAFVSMHLIEDCSKPVPLLCFIIEQFPEPRGVTDSEKVPTVSFYPSIKVTVIKNPSHSFRERWEKCGGEWEGYRPSLSTSPLRAIVK